MGEEKTDGSDVEKLKSLLFFLPIFGTTAALTFDVGYFAGIDINLFTLFSLSEHILFVFEALPLALVLALLLASGIVGAAAGKDLDLNLDWDAPLSDRSIRLLKYGYVGRSIRFLAERLPSARWTGLSLMLVTIMWGVLWPPKGWVAAVGFFGVALTGIVLITPSWLKRSRRAQLSLACIVGLLCIFLAGRVIAKQYIEANDSAHFVDTKEGMLEGKVIRSGDKGMLFHDAKANSVLFLKWDDIKRVAAPRRNPNK